MSHFVNAVKSIGNGFVSVGKAVGNGLVTAGKAVGNGLVTAGKAVGNGLVTAGKAIAKSVSKDGALTNFVQNYIPGGGLVTAIVHSAAGNRDYAEYAAVKGLSTTVTTALTAVGSLAGPGGAALMAGVGSVAGNLIEGGFKGLMRPTVKDKLDDITLEGVGMSFGIGAGVSLLGPAGKALKGSGVGKAVSGAASKVAKSVSSGGSKAYTAIVNRIKPPVPVKVPLTRNPAREYAKLLTPKAKAVTSISYKPPPGKIDRATAWVAAPFVKVGNKVSGGVSKASAWVSPPKYGPAPKPQVSSLFNWNTKPEIYKRAIKSKVYGATTIGVNIGREVANPIAKKIDSSGTLSKLMGVKSTKSSRGPVIAGTAVGTALVVGAGVMVMKDKAPTAPTVPVVGAPVPQKDAAVAAPAVNATKPAQAEAPVIAPVAAPKPGVAKASRPQVESPAKPGTANQSTAVVQPPVPQSPAPAVESVQNVPPVPAQQQVAQPPAQRPVQQPAQAAAPAQQQVAQPAPPAQRPGQSAQQPLPAQQQLPPQVAAPATQGGQRPLPSQQQLPPQHQYPAQPAPQPYYPPVQAPPPQQTAPQPYYPPIQAPPYQPPAVPRPVQPVAPQPYYPPVQAPPPQQVVPPPVVKPPVQQPRPDRETPGVAPPPYR